MTTPSIIGQPPLGSLEHDVIAVVENLREQLRYATHQARAWIGVLRRSAMARAVQGSNTIEGIHVSLDDALAAIAGDDPVEAEAETWQAIENYSDAMTFALQAARDPHFVFSADIIKTIHFLIVRHDLARNPGRWRPGPVFVHSSETGQVVYEGADVRQLPALMGALVDYLKAPATAPSLVRGAMAHLNLVLIHPFSDGNGRAARVLQSLVLTREGILEPEFCNIEEYLGRTTQAYYAVLAEVGQGEWRPGADALPWVHFCLTAHYHQANRLLRRTRETERLWESLSRLAERRGLHQRMVFALFDAATGMRLRNSTYRISAEVSENLASRDLKHMVDSGLLVATGERRARTYAAAPELKQLRAATREPRAVEAASLFAQRQLPL